MSAEQRLAHWRKELERIEAAFADGVSPPVMRGALIEERAQAQRLIKFYEGRMVKQEGR